MANTINFNYFGSDFEESTQYLVDSWSEDLVDVYKGFKVGTFISSKSMNTSLSMMSLVDYTIVKVLLDSNLIDTDQLPSSIQAFTFESFLAKADRAQYVQAFEETVKTYFKAMKNNLATSIVNNTSISKNTDGTYNLSVAVVDNT